MSRFLLCNHPPDVWACTSNRVCQLGQFAVFGLSEERVEHACLQTFGWRNIPRRELESDWSSFPSWSTRTNEPSVCCRGGSRKRRSSAGKPRRWPHTDPAPIETSTPESQRRPKAWGETPWKTDSPGLTDVPLSQTSSATEVAEGLKAHFLQGLLVREAEQDGDQTRHRTSAQQQFLQLRWGWRGIASPYIGHGFTANFDLISNSSHMIIKRHWLVDLTSSCHKTCVRCLSQREGAVLGPDRSAQTAKPSPNPRRWNLYGPQLRGKQNVSFTGGKTTRHTNMKVRRRSNRL